MSIYVEILVRAPMDALWSHTQTPAVHGRWDVRFSRIGYLPRNGESEPQRFQILIEGRPAPASGDEPSAMFIVATPGYFPTMPDPTARWSDPERSR